MTKEVAAPDASYRMARIERLLTELRFEIERGMMDGEIDETVGYQFYVPISKSIPDGVVHCEFLTRPIPRHFMRHDAIKPRLQLVKGKADA